MPKRKIKQLGLWGRGGEGLMKSGQGRRPWKVPFEQRPEGEKGTCGEKYPGQEEHRGGEDVWRRD